MSGRQRLSSWLSTLTWALGGWTASHRRPAAGADDVARLDYRTQTRGMTLRMTEWLRDRLRPSWLRIRHSDLRDGDS